MDQNQNEHGPAPVNDECPHETQGAVVLDAHLEEPRSTTRTPTTATPIPEKLREVADQSLAFLSNASNGTLGVCIAGLGACTYFILGRIGLVVIGVVCGAVLHATWENKGQSVGNQDINTAELNRRRQVGIDVVSRVLEWRQTSAPAVGSDQEAGTRNVIKVPTDRDLEFEGFKPATGAALTGLTDAVVRDYVKYAFSELAISFTDSHRWWYGPLLPSDKSFPSTCRQTLTSFLLTFSYHLCRKRPADTFVDFFTNTSSILIVFINELSAALMRPDFIKLETSDALNRYLDETPDSHLANVIDEEQQQRKLKAVAEDILHNFLDSKAYNCEPGRVFLREVLAGLILDMTIVSCSKPEFINGWIVYLLEEADTELIDAIDAGVGGATSNGIIKTASVAAKNTELGRSDATDDPSAATSEVRSEHQRTVSKAEDTMGEAMREARRLTELIAAEEAKRNQEPADASSSGTTTADGPTPTSSESDLAASTQEINEDPMIRPLPAPEGTPIPSFTTFDQIVPHQQTTALQTDSQSSLSVAQPLTLHNASISIFDDEQPGEKVTMRSKPTIDYLIQVEPATSQHPGWMIPRKYTDFETLHEVLRRISIVSGVAAFAEKHASIPAWKNRTKAAFRNDLEHYLRDALSFAQLAESEGMKRFLEKEQGLDRSSPNIKQGGFGFPSPAVFETMGKGMLDVLSSAPKGAASGGKAVVGGFTGVLGLGQKKASPASANRPASRSISRPSASLPRIESSDSILQMRAARQSENGLHNANGAFSEVTGLAQASDRPIYIPQKMENGYVVPADNDTPTSTPPKQSLENVPQPDFHLPPPPSEIPDDYNAFQNTSTPITSTTSSSVSHAQPPQQLSQPPSSPPTPAPPTRPPPLPLTEPETRITIELFFALLTELYTLSPSTWSIRLTLLRTAKIYLLRPGNPSMSSIRSLLQSTILDAQTSDTGIAAHVNKIRENVLPTEEERAKWPKELSAEERERLRIKARRLLVEKGVPAAVRGVMGGQATGEAMGRVFDALQVGKVARGWVFAVLLQAVRAVAQ